MGVADGADTCYFGTRRRITASAPSPLYVSLFSSYLSISIPIYLSLPFLPRIFYPAFPPRRPSSALLFLSSNEGNLQVLWRAHVAREAVTEGTVSLLLLRWSTLYRTRTFQRLNFSHAN